MKEIMEAIKKIQNSTNIQIDLPNYFKIYAQREFSWKVILRYYTPKGVMKDFQDLPSLRVPQEFEKNITSNFIRQEKGVYRAEYLVDPDHPETEFLATIWVPDLKIKMDRMFFFGIISIQVGYIDIVNGIGGNLRG